MHNIVIWSLIVVLAAIAGGLFWLNNYAKRGE